MGVFSKIKEIIRRIKTPKLSEGNNYIQNQNNNQLQFPYYIALPNGENFEVVSIQTKGNINHSNGEKTNLLIAKAFSYQNGDTIYVDSPENIAFELQQGTPINEVIMQKIGQYYAYEKNMPDNNKECMYLGKLSQDPYDLSTNNKSKAVENYINREIVPQIVREKQAQVEKQMQSYKERQERKNTNHREFINGIYEKQKVYEQQQIQIKSRRKENPYLEQASNEYIAKDGKKYCDYNGINVINGDFLRLRRMNKVGKDENGTYIYTGYIKTVQNKDDAEMLSRNRTPSGIPVCFATDKKIEEIMQSNNPNDLRTLLSLLSEKSEDFNNNNGYLNYIGKIDRHNAIDKNIGNTTQTIQSNVQQLQQKFYQEKIQEQQVEQNQIE